MTAGRILDQLTRIRVGHPVGGMGHGVSHQHEASIGALGPELDDEIAHLVAARRQAELAHQRHDLFRR